MKIIIAILLNLLPFLIFSQDWVKEKTKNGITVYTRKKGNIKEFKAVTTYKCTKSALEKEFIDISKMNEWYDMVDRVDLIKKLSDKEAIYRIKFKFPAIVQDRYSTIKAGISYDQNNNLIVTSSYFKINHDTYENCVFVDELESKWVISGEDNNLSITHTGFMNPKGNIPDWLVNSSVTDGPIKTLTNLKKRLGIK